MSLALQTIMCNKCSFVVTIPKTGVAGCGCDPDAPSWLGLMTDGRLLKMSCADYKVLEEKSD